MVIFIYNLQNYANCDMAVDPDVGDEVRNNREVFEATAKEWTEKYACCSVCCKKHHYVYKVTPTPFY